MSTTGATCPDINSKHYSSCKCIHVEVFNHLFIYVLQLEIKFSRGKGWDTINRFNPATFLCLSYIRTWISNIMSLSFLCSVSSVKMRGDCLFCWHWWNRWPLLFKLTSHNEQHFLICVVWLAIKLNISIWDITIANIQI